MSLSIIWSDRIPQFLFYSLASILRIRCTCMLILSIFSVSDWSSLCQVFVKYRSFRPEWPIDRFWVWFQNLFSGLFKIRISLSNLNRSYYSGLRLRTLLCHLNWTTTTTVLSLILDSLKSLFSTLSVLKNINSSSNKKANCSP